MGEVRANRKRVGLGKRVARKAPGIGKQCRPLQPLSVSADVRHPDEGVGKEGVLPCCDTVFAGVPAKLFVTLAHQSKGVFVEAQPDVQAMLFDSTTGPTSGRAFAPEAPSELVNGDVVATAMLRPAQFECGCHRGTTAADHGDFCGGVIVCQNRILSERP